MTSRDAPRAPDTPRVDKAALLNGFYIYLGGRIDSIGRRASFMKALLGSFLGVASAAITHGQPISLSAKVAFLLSHPSILSGIAAIGTLLFSEIAKVSISNDLFSRIGFSEEATSALHESYAEATINDLFGELIVNARIVGALLKRKVRLYNAGSILFVVSVVLFLCGV